VPAVLHTELCGCLVEVDTDATARWYAAADAWGCTCADCRNFLLLAAQNGLPAP